MKLSDYIKMFDIDINEMAAMPDIDELRIVKGTESGVLESLDDDGEDIFGNSLKLNESCAFDFDKHTEAITLQEIAEVESRKKKYSTPDDAYDRRAEFDRRYLDRPANKTRFRKK